MANRRQRAGMTIHARGGSNSEGSLGWWQDRFEVYPIDSFVQRAGRELDAIHKAAMRLHNQNRSQLEKKVIPELPVRITLARQEQRKLTATLERLAQVENDFAAWQQRSFQPYDYSKGSKPSETFAARVEL